MLTITKIFEFAAAHHLPYHRGLCKNPHGHNFKLEITVSGEVQKEGPERGMIMDFGNLKEAVGWALLDYDHCNLNDKFDNPTAEIMVRALARYIQNIFYVRKLKTIKIVKVRLWETSTSYVTWRAEQC